MKTVTLYSHIGAFGENKDTARKLRLEVLIPALAKGDSVTLDFDRVTGVTQSFMHALISDVIRKYSDHVFERLLFKNCTLEVQEVVNIVADYMEES